MHTVWEKLPKLSSELPDSQGLDTTVTLPNYVVLVVWGTEGNQGKDLPGSCFKGSLWWGPSDPKHCMSQRSWDHPDNLQEEVICSCLLQEVMLTNPPMSRVSASCYRFPCGWGCNDSDMCPWSAKRMATGHLQILVTVPWKKFHVENLCCHLWIDWISMLKGRDCQAEFLKIALS